MLPNRGFLVSPWLWGCFRVEAGCFLAKVLFPTFVGLPARTQ